MERREPKLQSEWAGSFSRPRSSDRQPQVRRDLHVLGDNTSTARRCGSDFDYSSALHSCHRASVLLGNRRGGRFRVQRGSPGSTSGAQHLLNRAIALYRRTLRVENRLTRRQESARSPNPGFIPLHSDRCLIGPSTQSLSTTRTIASRNISPRRREHAGGAS